MNIGVVTLILATGEPRFEWCDECLLPSVLEFDIYRLCDDGPHLCGTYRQCQDHG